MKTPTWATVIGILMIVIGGCSVMNDIKSITLPSDMIKAKTEIKKGFDEERKQRSDSTVASADSVLIDSVALAERKQIDEEQKKVEGFLNVPEFSQIWIVRFGYIGLAATAFYILGGVFLLIKRRFSIKLVYAALAISMLTSAAQAGVLLSPSSSGVVALATGLGQCGGIVIDIILLAVIFTSDKEAYVFK